LHDIPNFYQFLSIIGTGKYGEIYLSKNLISGQNFAIKTQKKAILSEKQARIEALFNEIRILRKINHPNISKIYQVFEDDCSVFIVLEYVHSENNFIENILNGIPYSEDWVKKHFKGVIEGLKYLHENHIIHRDLKLENLVLNENEEMKIIDFGNATIIGKKGSSIGKTGSPGYMAPEVKNGKKYNEKADIFSMGIILYYFLTGGKKLISERDLNGNYEFDIEDCMKLSKEIRLLLNLMLQNDHEKRITAENMLKNDWFNDRKDFLNAEQQACLINNLELNTENLSEFDEKIEKENFNNIKICQKPKVNKTPKTLLGKRNIIKIENKISDVFKFCC